MKGKPHPTELHVGSTWDLRSCEDPRRNRDAPSIEKGVPGCSGDVTVGILLVFFPQQKPLGRSSAPRPFAAADSDFPCTHGLKRMGRGRRKKEQKVSIAHPLCRARTLLMSCKGSRVYFGQSYKIPERTEAYQDMKNIFMQQFRLRKPVT